MTHITPIPGPADSPSANGATEAASGREASTRQQQAVCQGSGVQQDVGAPRVSRSALEAIAENTAADHGMTLKAIHERTHAWPVSWPRQDAMRLQREQLGASYPQIARYWGMDHTGALYGVRRSRARRDSREAAACP